MEILLAYVMSLDGYMVDGSGSSPTQWASPEDQAHFRALVREYGLVLMGSNTYESHKDSLLPEKGLLRIVMTRTPEKYHSAHTPDSLEFSSQSPRTLIEELEKRGYQKALLAGGPVLFAEFFKEKLISELAITIEPVMFGAGIASSSGIPKEIALQLIDIQHLNTRGTLLARYKVV